MNTKFIYSILILLTISLFFKNIGYCQSNKETAVSLINEDVFVLNSINNDYFMGGMNRNVYSIKLPDNTIRWFYSIVAYRDKEKIQQVESQMNLVGNLTKLIDKSGTTKLALSLMSKPPSADYCNVYLFPSYNDAQNFKNNNEYNYSSSASRLNCTSCGLVEVSNSEYLSGTQYIGIQNPSNAFSINCKLQVVAIVQNVEYADGWTKEKIDEFYNSVHSQVIKVFDSFSKDTGNEYTMNDVREMTDCIVDKYINISMNDINTMPEYKKNQLFGDFFQECIEEMNEDNEE